MINLKSLANELKLPETTIKRVYNLYWLFIRKKIESLELKDLPEEELRKIKSSFNIPSIGKFALNYKKIKYAKNGAKNKKCKTNV